MPRENIFLRQLFFCKVFVLTRKDSYVNIIPAWSLKQCLEIKKQLTLMFKSGNISLAVIRQLQPIMWRCSLVG